MTLTLVCVPRHYHWIRFIEENIKGDHVNHRSMGEVRTHDGRRYRCITSPDYMRGLRADDVIFYGPTSDFDDFDAWIMRAEEAKRPNKTFILEDK